MDSSTSPPISPNTVSPSAVGAALRRRRQELNLSLHDLAQQLCIRQVYLEALEEGDFNRLPPKTYATGFVRSYAQHVHLDPVNLSTQFGEEFSRAAKKEEPHFTPRPLPEGRFPGARILWVAAVSTAAAYGLWLLLAPSGHQKVDIPSPPIVATSTVASQSSVPVADPHPVPVASDQSAPSSFSRSNSAVSIKATEDSWIEIRSADDELLVSKVLQAGEVYELPHQAGLKLATGNAGGITIGVDNQTLSHLGPPGKVMRNITLDSKALLKRFPVSPAP